MNHNLDTAYIYAIEKLSIEYEISSLDLCIQFHNLNVRKTIEKQFDENETDYNKIVSFIENQYFDNVSKKSYDVSQLYLYKGKDISMLICSEIAVIISRLLHYSDLSTFEEMAILFYMSAVHSKIMDITSEFFLKSVDEIVIEYLKEMNDH